MNPIRPTEPLRLLTVDVEPDWGIQGNRGIEEVLPQLILLLDERRIKATFFVVGELLELSQPIIRKAAMNHEIGSHGLTHRKLDRLPLKEIERELRESLCKLQRSGEPPGGFRAPFFLAPPGLLAMLSKAGYQYDSSLARPFPSTVNLRAGRWKPILDGVLTELPPTTLRDGLTPFSMTYMRLLRPLSRYMVDKRAAMFYMHLHEFLPPRTADVLPRALRWMLRRNAGGNAWRILDDLLNRWRGTFVTCSEYLKLVRR